MNQEKHLPKSTKIFENKNIWLVLIKVMFPQIFSSFVNGLYILISQIFLNLFVPKVYPNDKVWSNYCEVSDFWSGLQFKGEQLQLENTSNIVHSAVAISISLVIIITAISSWLSMGVSILFGSAIGRKNTAEATRIWTAWLFPTLIFCVIISLILGSSSHAILYDLSGSRHAANLDFITTNLSNPTSLNPYSVSLLTNFYKTYYATIVSYAFQYVFPIIISLFLQVFVLTTWFSLASEGKQMVMMSFALCCNLVNVGVSFLLINIAKLGMLGGGLSVAFTYVFNALLLIAYLVFLEKRSLSLMTLKLIHWKIDWIIFASSMVTGISSLFRNISSSFCLLLFQTLLVATTMHIGYHSPTYWLNFGGAVNPIQNLLFSTSVGTVRGTRVVFSYHLGAGNDHYVKKIFFIGVLYSVILMSILFSIMATRSTGLALMETVFDLKDPTADVANDALRYLRFVSGGLIMYGFMMVGMAFFQVSGRVLSASATAIFSGIGCGAIVFPTAMAIAEANKSEIVYIAGWTANAILAGLTIFLYTLIYMKLCVKPGYKIRHPVDRFNAWIEKQKAKRAKVSSWTTNS